MKTVINNTKDLLFFDKKIIQRLQKLANKSEKKRSRICCHLSTRNKTISINKIRRKNLLQIEKLTKVKNYKKKFIKK